MDIRTRVKINEITNIIRELVPLEEIILFDIEEIEENKNISLSILINDEGSRKDEVFKKLKENITPLTNLSIQLLIYYKDEFYKMASMNRALEENILEKGIRIYG